MIRLRALLPSIAALFALSLMLCSVARAVEPDEKLADPALEARARALTQELRCVVCQNQSVDDSDAPLAKDIRVLVRERIAAGDSDEAVRAFIVARYGKFVLLRPPFEGDTIVLWLAPAVVFVLGLGLAVWYFRQLKKDAPPVALSAEEEERLRRIVGDGRG